MDLSSQVYSICFHASPTLLPFCGFVLISGRVSSSQSYLLVNLASHRFLSLKGCLVNQVLYKTSSQNFVWDCVELLFQLPYFMKYDTWFFL